jgi:hypothetical protein
MKRSIIVLIVAGAMLLALPATAKKPPTEPPPVLACEFDSEGVLTNSEGQPIELDRANSGIRCQLAADPSDSFKFVIYTNDGANVISFPYIAVTDVYPYGGNTCFHDYVRGRATNSEGETDFEFGAFETGGALDTYRAPGDDLYDGRCGERDDTDGADTYALTFQVQKISGGTVHLTMTEG